MVKKLNNPEFLALDPDPDHLQSLIGSKLVKMIVQRYRLIVNIVLPAAFGISCVRVFIELCSIIGCLSYASVISR